MKPTLPTVLSVNAGYVDTAGFLAMHGLFTAHVTGNFVMIGDALAHGSAGIIAKLLALPVFCVTILILQSIALRAVASPARAMRVMLIAKFLFFTVAAIAAIGFGEFTDPDRRPTADRQGHAARRRDGNPECGAPAAPVFRSPVDPHDRNDHASHARSGQSAFTPSRRIGPKSSNHALCA
nr:DUF1275 family protein [Salinicola peritrichatus]